MGRILIVDDEVAIGMVLGRLLTLAGHKAEHVNSGDDALARLALEIPDLLILDVMMPGMDGHEILRRLRADPRTAAVPIVIYTGISDPQFHEGLIKMGANDAIVKASMTFDETLARLAKYLPMAA